MCVTLAAIPWSGKRSEMSPWASNEWGQSSKRVSSDQIDNSWRATLGRYLIDISIHRAKLMGHFGCPLLEQVCDPKENQQGSRFDQIWSSFDHLIINVQDWFCERVKPSTAELQTSNKCSSFNVVYSQDWDFSWILRLLVRLEIIVLHKTRSLFSSAAQTPFPFASALQFEKRCSPQSLAAHAWLRPVMQLSLKAINFTLS